ncbi:hypothetical protein Y032_0011g1391 [Ancylostoma ceylanicum]|nr:hypothetical protein Y032_0011g1391 [Ancylostoma ceylanicum]
MSSQLESMQSVLPPTVSPGWNDPPNLGGAAAPAASNRLAQLRKRPVDPSISSSSAGGGMMTHQPGQPPDHGYPHGAGDNRHPGHSQHHNSPEQYGVVPTPVSVGIPTSPPVPGVTTTQATVQMFAQPQQQYTHHVAPVHSSSTAISAPQLPQTTVTATHLPQGALEQHYPTTTATPYTQAMPAAHPTLHYNQSPMGTSVQSQDVHAQNAQMANHQQFFHQQQYHGAPPIHRRVLTSTSPTTPPATTPTNQYSSSSSTSPLTSFTSAITTLSTSSPAMPSSTTQREAHRPVYDAFTVSGGSAGAKSVDPFLIRSHSNPNQHQHQHSTHVAWSAASADSALTSSSSSSPTMPRAVPTKRAPSPDPPSLQPNDFIASLPNCVVDSARRPSTHEGVNYRKLHKAPGDVSMSRQQIILCLSAASKKLSPNIHRGVQLRISELKDAMDEGRISEKCLKSLNYVVDSIDREKYDDAHTFFDRLKAECPDEMGPWAQQGIRLLINELRRPAARIGSAGPHLRSQ